MCAKDLLADAKAYVEEVWDDIERDIDSLVRIESVEDLEHAAEGMPFGPAPRQALDAALGIAERLGLEVSDCDGYLGIAELPGESEGYLATIAHSDIVPVGTGWHFDPLRLTRKDGYLIARGVRDDKGPLVLSLYAAHYLVRKVRESGKKLPYTLRCLVGTNEETGMVDVDYYLARYPQPIFCFTPDADFPAICGEKGRVFVELLSPVIAEKDARILSFAGGAASNAVASDAEAVVVATPDEIASREGLEILSAGKDAQGRSLVKLLVKGRGGHAAMPEGTCSAVGMLCDILRESGVCTEKELAFLDLQKLVFADTRGAALCVDAIDEVFDPLTCAGTVAMLRDDQDGRYLVQGLDIRYPTSTSAEVLGERLNEVAAAHGCKAVVRDASVPFLTSPDSKEVQTLLSAYHDVFECEGEAFTIGGGTYARHFQRAVAFGPVPSTTVDPDWVGPEHGPDEGVSVEIMQRALQTYVVALMRLMELDLG